jgi:hypothetical protein
MAELYDLTIHLGALTLPAVLKLWGLPPGYSMQAAMDQVPGATLNPEGYWSLLTDTYAYDPLRTESLFVVLSYYLMLVPSTPLETLDALYEDLEGKAWKNWGLFHGMSSADRPIPPHAFSKGI